MANQNDQVPAFRRFEFTRGAIAIAIVLFANIRMTEAQTPLTVANPHWNITLTDFGYSDFLLDNTPGFEGREYLSGEWAAAIGYEVTGKPVVTPQWLEPHFSYPDWTTPSTFQVMNPITPQAPNADGLPVARSVVTNADLQVTLDYEMLDTIVGTPMGTMPASAGGGGTFVNSDRYVLKQTYTVKNISGTTITNVQFFQFLHGLQSQRGMYDNRLHTGPFSSYRYDVTAVGIDPWAIGPGSSTNGLEDYIGFHSAATPTAYEIGYYGIEGNGVDNHVMGKPSEGVHLSIENNWSSAPYSSRQGIDDFAPAQRWIAGAERWSLGNLAAGQSVSLDVLLSLRTGTVVAPGTGSTGGCNGGSSVPGGMDYTFDDVTGAGSCFAEYSQADAHEIDVRIAHGEFGLLTFLKPGGLVQIWNVSFSGTFAGTNHLAFSYDPMVLPAGFDANTLCIYQYHEGAWHLLDGTVDTLHHTITVAVTNLSAFALGAGGSTARTVSAGSMPVGGGTITGAGTYADGSEATLIALPNTGYAFSNWTEDASIVSASPSYTFVVNTDRTLTAHFTVVGSAKTVATGSLPGNGGTTSGDGAYPSGSSATVVAVPNNGYKFSKWLREGSTVSTSPSYTFTVTTDIVVTAKFKPVYKVVVTADTVDCDVEADSAVYDPGDLATLKVANYASGYDFVNWTEHDLPVSTDPDYQFYVSGNRELVGHFAPGHRIAVSVNPPHAGTAGGGGVYADGANLTVDATANPGYVFLNWTEGGTEVALQSSYSLTADARHTLVANFLEQPTLRLANPDAVTLSWPADASGWILQESADLTPASWSNATHTVNIVGAQKQVTIAPSAAKGFFRLQHP